MHEPQAKKPEDNSQFSIADGTSSNTFVMLRDTRRDSSRAAGKRCGVVASVPIPPPGDRSRFQPGSIARLFDAFRPVSERLGEPS